MDKGNGKAVARFGDFVSSAKNSNQIPKNSVLDCISVLVKAGQKRAGRATHSVNRAPDTSLLVNGNEHNENEPIRGF